MKSKDIDNLQEQIDILKNEIQKLSNLIKPSKIFINYGLIKSKSHFPKYFGEKGRYGKHTPEWKWDEELKLFIGNVHCDTKKEEHNADVLIGLTKEQMDFIKNREIYCSYHDKGLFVYWVVAQDKSNNKKEISLSETFGFGKYDISQIIHPKTKETVYEFPYILLNTFDNDDKIQSIQTLNINKDDILVFKFNEIKDETIDFVKSLKNIGITNRCLLIDNNVDISKISINDIKNIENMVKCPYCDEYTKRKFKYSTQTLLGYENIVDENGKDITNNPNVETQHVECLKCHNDFTIEKKNGKIINVSK